MQKQPMSNKKYQCQAQTPYVMQKQRMSSQNTLCQAKTPQVTQKLSNNKWQ